MNWQSYSVIISIQHSLFLSKVNKKLLSCLGEIYDVTKSTPNIIIQFFLTYPVIIFSHKLFSPTIITVSYVHGFIFHRTSFWRPPDERLVRYIKMVIMMLELNHFAIAIFVYFDVECHMNDSYLGHSTELFAVEGHWSTWLPISSRFSNVRAT